MTVIQGPTFLIANYTSPPQRAFRPWLHGQLGRTGNYLMVVEFVEK